MQRTLGTAHSVKRERRGVRGGGAEGGGGGLRGGGGAEGMSKLCGELE